MLETEETSTNYPRGEPGSVAGACQPSIYPVAPLDEQVFLKLDSNNKIVATSGPCRLVATDLR